MEKFTVRLYKLVGNSVEIKQDIPGCEESEARNIAIRHAIEHRFTNVKFIDDEGYGELRVTATTPNGRAGRNIGTITPDC